MGCEIFLAIGSSGNSRCAASQPEAEGISGISGIKDARDFYWLQKEGRDTRGWQHASLM